jgi:hypothetical protein
VAEGDYTPELVESDAGLGRVVLQEEAGARKSYPETCALTPCEHCGTLVILGELPDGTRIAVEQETLTYVLYWRQKTVKRGQAAPPTLTQSRGYPAHHCGGSHG